MLGIGAETCNFNIESLIGICDWYLFLMSLRGLIFVRDLPAAIDFFVTNASEVPSLFPPQQPTVAKSEQFASSPSSSVVISCGTFQTISRIAFAHFFNRTRGK